LITESVVYRLLCLLDDLLLCRLQELLKRGLSLWVDVGGEVDVQCCGTSRPANMAQSLSEALSSRASGGSSVIGGTITGQIR
jgi:hypothetical protein